MMNQYRRLRLMDLLIVLATVGLGSVASAKEPECKYFETLTNCGGDGGWLVVYEDGGGQTSIVVLCDGGAVGTPQ